MGYLVPREKWDPEAPGAIPDNFLKAPPYEHQRRTWEDTHAIRALKHMAKRDQFMTVAEMADVLGTSHASAGITLRKLGRSGLVHVRPLGMEKGKGARLGNRPNLYKLRVAARRLIINAHPELDG